MRVEKNKEKLDTKVKKTLIQNNLAWIGPSETLLTLRKLSKLCLSILHNIIVALKIIDISRSDKTYSGVTSRNHAAFADKGSWPPHSCPEWQLLDTSSVSVVIVFVLVHFSPIDSNACSVSWLPHI